MPSHRPSFEGLVRRSIQRRPFRSAATLLCFALVAGSLVSTYFLAGGTRNSFDVGISRLGADMIVAPEAYGSQAEAVIFTGKPSTFLFNSSIVDQVREIQGISEASPQVYVATLSNAPCCTLPVQLIGIDPSTDFTVTPWLKSELGRPLNTNEVLVGSSIIGAVGSQLKFYGTNFTIAGRLEPTGTGLDLSVFMRADDAYTMAEQSGQLAVQKLNLQRGQISSVLVKVTNGEDPTAVASRIEAQIPGTVAITSDILVRKITAQLSSASNLLYVVTLVVAVVSVPLVALVTTMGASERRREIGLLRAMGAKKGFIFRMILVEGLLVATVGGALGIATSAVIVYSFQTLIATSLLVPFLFPPILETLGYVGITLVVAITAGGLASLYPAFTSSRLEPYEAIRRGEL